MPTEMSHPPAPNLHFRDSFDEYEWYEISCKGWYTGAVAELPEGKLYPLTFYDPVRLAQESASEFERGKPCFAEHALVVVPEVTVAAMRASTERLFLQGWFAHLAPSTATTPLEALRLAGAG